MSRRFELNDDRSILTVTDIVDPKVAIEAYWQIHVGGDIQVAEDGQSAILLVADDPDDKQRYKQSKVVIKNAPAGAVFTNFSSPASSLPTPL